MRGLTFRLLLAVCLVTSTVQGFIAQTHVHGRPAVAATSAAVTAAADRVTREEPSCPLCAIAGHTPAVAPPAQPSAQALPLLPASAPPTVACCAFASLASHHWRSRGPPTA